MALTKKMHDLYDTIAMAESCKQWLERQAPVYTSRAERLPTDINVADRLTQLTRIINSSFEELTVELINKS